MRAYEESHPWIRFGLDLRSADPRLWMLLGEARSKIEHLAGVPLRVSTAQDLHMLYLAKGVHATTAIEGNTLSEEQVGQIVQGTLTLPASQRYLQKEVQNVIDACDRIVREIVTGTGRPLDADRLNDFDRAVLDGLELDPEVVPGEIRTHPVVVGGYRGAPAGDCAYLVDQLCRWLSGPDFRERPEMGLGIGILKAILAHLYIAWIHPFGDGNGRTARLVEFQILVECGVPTLVAHLLSNHYNLTRTDYYRHLDRARRSNDDVLAFVEYALQGLVDGLSEQIERVRSQQFDLTWRDYVADRFRDSSGPTAERRRHLLFDLAQAREPVVRGDIRGLTPRLAAAYSTKTGKTLTRDLNALASMGSIEFAGRIVRARTEIILGFLPIRRAQSDPRV